MRLRAGEVAQQVRGKREHVVGSGECWRAVVVLRVQQEAAEDSGSRGSAASVRGAARTESVLLARENAMSRRRAAAAAGCDGQSLAVEPAAAAQADSGRIIFRPTFRAGCAARGFSSVIINLHASPRPPTALARARGGRRPVAAGNVSQKALLAAAAEHHHSGERPREFEVCM